MNILSLFDGISVARVALERTGIPVSKYYASEIDRYAISVSKKNYPDIEHLGDVRGISGYNLPKINIIIGGSPCQDLSIAKKNRAGLSGERSGLFWEYVRLKEMLKPDYFILENVASMPASARQTITNALGVEPIMINAALVSAQNRKRLFWTNIPNIEQPADREILLKDVLENYQHGDKVINLKLLNFKGSELKSVAITATCYKEPPKVIRQNAVILEDFYKGRKTRTYETKSPTLRSGRSGLIVRDDNNFRKLLPTECEKLQGLPNGYTDGISNSQRYKVLGNAFNADVVSHILSFIPKEKL